MADFYTASGDPAQSSSIDSSVIRAEYALIATGFTKVAGYTAAANRVVHINSGATAQATTSGFTFDGTTFTAPALAVTNNSTLTGDLAVNGGDITSTATTFNLLNATVTTLNLGGAATTIALGAATGTFTVGPAIVGSIATDSTSPTTGAWKTAGGLGVAKALWVGGLANIAGAVTMQTNATVPIIIGGTAAGSSAEIRSTSGTGSGDYVKITGGTNGATEIARFNDNTSGALCIGATAAIGTERLSVQDNANKASVYISNNGTSITTYMLAIQGNTAAGTGWKLINGGNAAGDCFYVLGNGNVQNTNNSYAGISDKKLKTNIAPSGSQWEDVKALARMVSKYTMKADPERRTQIGLIAQDVQRVSPGLVFAVPDAEAFEQVPARKVRRDDGNEELIPAVMGQRHTGTDTLAVNYSVLNVKALKALGEALERIEKLEGKP